MKPSVLVIDDATDVHKLLDVRLRGEDLVLHHAFEPAAGLAMARTLMPALVLLDLEMPGMSGIEVCKVLKADPATAGIPVIFLTAHDGVGDRAAGLEAGAVAYVTKPFEPAELRARVREVIKGER